jgi:hypothetical protein
MALATLMGHQPSPLGQMVQFDAKTMRSAPFRFDAAPEPEQSFAFVAPEMLGAGDTIVELRGADEAPVAAHPDAQRILPTQLKHKLPIAEGRLALCCGTGLRAWRAAEITQKFWSGEIVLVAASAS